MPDSVPRPAAPGANRSLWLVLPGLLLLVAAAAWYFNRPPKPQPVLEAVRYARELHLVKFHYETIIPVTRGAKGKKLEFLMVAPAEVNGYLDLGKARFRMAGDQLVEITLPPPRISPPYLNLDQTEEYLTRRNPVRLFLPGNTALRDAYEDLRGAIESARVEVAARARANGIEAETARRGEQYLRNLFASLGYAAQFAPAEGAETRDDARLRAELEAALESAPERNRRLGILQTLLSR